MSGREKEGMGRPVVHGAMCCSQKSFKLAVMLPAPIWVAIQWPLGMGGFLPKKYNMIEFWVKSDSKVIYMN